MYHKKQGKIILYLLNYDPFTLTLINYKEEHFYHLTLYPSTFIPPKLSKCIIYPLNYDFFYTYLTKQ